MSYVDSPAKKLVRLSVLECAMNVLGPDRFLRGRHMGLASKEAGDLAVLAGLGVTGQVIMAEKNKDAWADAKVRWRFADIRNEDLFDVAKKEGRFTHVNFDTCAPIRKETVDEINRLAANHLEPEGILTSWFLAGREHKDVMSEVDAMVELLQQQLTKEIRDKIAHEYPLKVLDERLTYIARAFVLEQSVNMFVHMTTKRHMKLVRIWTYTSTDYEAKKMGSPMVVVQLQNCKKNSVSLENSILAAIKHDHFIVIGDVRRRLGLKAISLLEAGRDPTLLLNSPKSLAAWQAHKTRGTYG
jgi:hypothetical protein